VNYFGQRPAGRGGVEYNLVLIDMALVLFFASANLYLGTWCGAPIEPLSTMENSPSPRRIKTANILR
jgi:hypothetical protein